MRAYQFMDEQWQAFPTMRATKLTGHSVHESLKIFGSMIPSIFDEKVSIYEWIERRFRSWELIYPRTNRDRRFGPWETTKFTGKPIPIRYMEAWKLWVYDMFDLTRRYHPIYQWIDTFSDHESWSIHRRTEAGVSVHEERQDLWVKQTRFGSWELENSWIYDTSDLMRTY